MGSEDTLVPDGQPEDTLAQAGPDGRLLIIEGGDHFEPVNGTADSPVVVPGVEATVAFFQVHVAGTEQPTSLDDLGLVEAD